MQLSFIYLGLRHWLFAVVFLLFGVSPVVTLAASYAFPSFTNYESFIEIPAPTQHQMYYGDLLGFPHTYYFSVSNETHIHVEILAPVIESIKTDLNAIIVKKQIDGSVAEVARMKAPTGTREEWHDLVGNDTYLRGPSYSGELTAGDYLLEINSPTNEGKYVLNIGTQEQSFFKRIINEVTRIYPVKRFFEKSVWAVFESPLFYIPSLLLLLFGVVYYVKRRRTAQ